MKKFLVTSLALLFSFAFSPSLFAQQGETRELKVMSFNIWVGGGKSLDETFRVVRETGVDIVGVQESTKQSVNVVEKFAEENGWHTHAEGSSRTILSHYPIVEISDNKKGCKIKLDDDTFVWMFNLHLVHCPYEPYQLNDIEYCGAPFLKTAEDAVDSAWKSRGDDVKATIADIKAAQKENCPIFLTGDFNEPSCLDWTEKAAEAGICKIPVDWPATRAFQRDADMQDAYRTKYPDEITHKGHTWTTLPAEREVLDRIDFLFFHGENVKLKDVFIVGEKSELTDIGFENYPSDHRAVLGVFTWPVSGKK